LTVGAAIERQKYATVADGAITARGSEKARTISATLGANISFTEDNVLGFSVTTLSRSNSLHGFNTRRFCVTEATGTVDGRSSSIDECEDYFVGSPRELSGGQIRFDWLRKIRVPVEPDSDNSPTLGLLISGSTDFQRGNEAKYNFSFGPTLHPTGDPYGLYGAVLFEWIDVSNVTNTKAEKRFFVRVYARVPFALL
jgi:hypothetical protein